MGGYRHSCLKIKGNTLKSDAAYKFRLSATSDVTVQSDVDVLTNGPPKGGQISTDSDQVISNFYHTIETVLISDDYSFASEL